MYRYNLMQAFWKYTDYENWLILMPNHVYCTYAYFAKISTSTCSSRSQTTEQCTLRHKTGVSRPQIVFEHSAPQLQDDQTWSKTLNTNKTSTENSQPGVFKLLSECSIWSNKVFRMQIYLSIYTVLRVHMIIQQLS